VIYLLKFERKKHRNENYNLLDGVISEILFFKTVAQIIWVFLAKVHEDINTYKLSYSKIAAIKIVVQG